MKPKRRSPSTPNARKGTFVPGSINYRVMAYMKQAGRATSREVHQDAMRHLSARTVRDAIHDLCRLGALVRVDSVRQPGVRQMVVYAHPEHCMPTEAYAPLPPVPGNERSLASKWRRRARVPSIFDWKP